MKSNNYGSLAKLTLEGYKELVKNFPQLTTEFKQYIFKYKDNLRCFLEMECDKIDYFKTLSMITKQELLFNMVRKTYNKGDVIYGAEEIVDRLIVIESGVVQLSVEYDKRRPNMNFILERLTTGAILNHKAFMVRDKADTSFICRTNVSCFELSRDKMESVMRKRADLREAKKDVERAVFTPY